MTILRVFGHQVVGMIPSELGQLRRLNVLVFRWTNLTGIIPSEFGNLSELCELRLTGNKHLHGELPQQLNKLSNLEILTLKSTPNVCAHSFKLQGTWQDGTWSRAVA